VNLPAEASPETLLAVFVEAWKLGLKSVAVYRDGSKRTQPLSTGAQEAGRPEARPARRRLPDEREAITHKFSIAGHEAYVTVGKYEDGSPGELFIVMSKEGSVVSGLLDSFATAVSLALQYGVPLKVLVDKFRNGRYEPSGFTNNPQIRIAKSITDYIFRWLALKYLPAGEAQAAVTDADEVLLALGQVPTPGPVTASGRGAAPGAEATVPPIPQATPMDMDAPPCPECGSIMMPAGSCFRCGNCGGTSGCS
jgi:ribonucleoside-diphosphate reductase alpha chain